MLFERYIRRAAARGYLTATAGLTGLFTLLAFVGELADVGTGTYTVGDALSYVLLISPQKLIEVSPVAMMLGCLLSLGAMARNAELTAFQSAGISEFRIIRAVLMLIVPVSAGLLLVSQFVVPPAETAALSLRERALGEAGSDSQIWVERDGTYLHVRTLAPGNRALGIDIFRFDGDDALTAYIHADSALIRSDDEWLLRNVTIKTIVGGLFDTRTRAALPWRSVTRPAEMRLLGRPATAVSATALLGYIEERRASGHPAPLYEGEFWSRAALPASMAALVLCAAPFLFGVNRARQVGSRMGAGTLVAILYSLFQQILARLGLVTDIPFVITAFAPPLALGLVGMRLLVRGRG